jgi:hypothetical protein
MATYSRADFGSSISEDAEKSRSSVQSFLTPLEDKARQPDHREFARRPLSPEPQAL